MRRERVGFCGDIMGSSGSCGGGGGLCGCESVCVGECVCVWGYVVGVWVCVGVCENSSKTGSITHISLCLVSTTVICPPLLTSDSVAGVTEECFRLGSCTCCPYTSFTCNDTRSGGMQEEKPNGEMLIEGSSENKDRGQTTNDPMTCSHLFTAQVTTAVS